MNPTPEQLIDSLLLVADQMYHDLQVHDAETANDYFEQLREIEGEYQRIY